VVLLWQLCWWNLLNLLAWRQVNDLIRYKNVGPIQKSYSTWGKCTVHFGDSCKSFLERMVPTTWCLHRRPVHVVALVHNRNCKCFDRDQKWSQASYKLTIERFLLDIHNLMTFTLCIIASEKRTKNKSCCIKMQFIARLYKRQQNIHIKNVTVFPSICDDKAWLLKEMQIGFFRTLIAI
jgi:hypothetical protein